MLDVLSWLLCGLPQAHPGKAHIALGCLVSSHLLASPRLAAEEFIPRLGIVLFFWNFLESLNLDLVLHHYLLNWI